MIAETGTLPDAMFGERWGAAILLAVRHRAGPANPRRVDALSTAAAAASLVDATGRPCSARPPRQRPPTPVWMPLPRPSVRVSRPAAPTTHEHAID